MALSYRPAQESGKILVGHTFFSRVAVVSCLILIGVGVVVLISIQGLEFTTDIKIIIGALILVPILLSANYERSILILFGFASVVGLLKMKTDFNPVIHVGMDIIIIILCFSWMFRRILGLTSTDQEKTPLGKLVGFFVVACLVQIFNPMSYDFIASVASLKMHISMIPLYFAGYHIPSNTLSFAS